MPSLSDAMEEGVILTWLIEDGQPVAVGDELVEIETDKATMTYAAEAEGVLEVVAAAGETVPVGQPIARLAEPGARAAVAEEDAGDAQPVNGAAVADGADAAPATIEVPVTEVPATEVPAAPRPGAAATASDGSVRATPLARRVAAIHGVGLDSITGTGPGGRVTKSDALAAAGIVAAPADRPSPAPPAPPSAVGAGADSSGPNGAKGHTHQQELSKLQTVIARRMAEAKATVPEFQVETEVAMDAAVALRAELKGLDAERPAPSFNDMIVKACGIALRNHPLANGSYKDARFELHERVNVGIAVAAEGALIVPTIVDADAKTLASIAAESRRLADRVRSGEITPPELAGGTFTVSNLGMFGMTAITPVINPPQAAILGVGALRPVLARDPAGVISDRTLMTLRLTCDHRILYGADAARFLAEVKNLLERPLSLLA